MELWQVVIALSTLLATVGGSVSVAVWAVGRINTAAEVLGIRMEALTAAINRLNAELDDHETRLRVLEQHRVASTQRSML